MENAESRVRTHAVVGIYTTTIKSQGEHTTTLHCRCGWSTETGRQWEARNEYRSHVKKVVDTNM